LYFYRDSTPTHSYMQAEYKYPVTEFPYKMLKNENRKRSLQDPEFELLDTGLQTVVDKYAKLIVYWSCNMLQFL